MTRGEAAVLMLGAMFALTGGLYDLDVLPLSPAHGLAVAVPAWAAAVALAWWSGDFSETVWKSMVVGVLVFAFGWAAVMFAAIAVGAWAHGRWRMARAAPAD